MQPVSFGQIPSYRVHAIGFGGSEQSKNNGTTYKSKEETDKKQALLNSYRKSVQLADLSDQQLLNIAKFDANRDDKYKFNTYAAMLAGIPIADTFIKGVTSEAPHLSGKLKTMGKVGAGWLGALALAGIYNGIVDKITAVSPVVKKAEDKHPVISSLLRLAGFAALLVGATKGVAKLNKTITAKFPGMVSDLSKVQTNIADKINNSKFNTKFISWAKEKATQFATKHPKIASSAIATAILAPPLLAAGTLFKAITEQSEKVDKINDNYKKLCNARAMTRQKLDEINTGLIVNQLNEELADNVDEQDIDNVRVQTPSLNEMA